MADILLTEAEFEAIKDVIAEAKAARAHFAWLADRARPIMRYDITTPELAAALAKAESIDLENPRRLEAKHADAQQQRTRPAKK